MNVFVLGGTGFIGYHAVRELLRRGHTVTVLALDLPKDDLLPKEVKYKLANVDNCSDDEIRDMLRGQDALVFAIGADDRVVPPAPAYDFFHKANVKPTERMFRLANEAGLKRGVLCSSYFAYFDRIWPEKKLSRYHPYVRVRQEQAEAAIKAGGGMAVSILELPYIFGNMPGRVPLWAPLIKYVRSSFPLFYTAGGTTMITIERVAEAVAGAVERPSASARYPIGDENLTWVEMLRSFCNVVGKKKRIITIPTIMAVITTWLLEIRFRLAGKEHGLNPVKFMQVQCINTFIRPEDLKASRDALGFGTGGLQQAFKDTVDACPS
jgi:dihydroflavonol-4-reductase